MLEIVDRGQIDVCESVIVSGKALAAGLVERPGLASGLLGIPAASALPLRTSATGLIMARLKTRLRRKQLDWRAAMTKAERQQWAKDWQEELQMWDRVGLVVSGLCMVHCAALPVLLAFAPSVAGTFFGGEHAHSWFAGISLVIAIGAFLPSFLQHRHCGVLALALIGLSAIGEAAINNQCCQVSASCPLCATGQECSATAHAVGSDAREPRAPQSATAMFASTWRQWQTPIGGVFLVVAHLLNARFRRQCCGACRTNNQHDAPASDRSPVSQEPLAGASG